MPGGAEKVHPKCTGTWGLEGCCTCTRALVLAMAFALARLTNHETHLKVAKRTLACELNYRGHPGPQYPPAAARCRSGAALVLSLSRTIFWPRCTDDIKCCQCFIAGTEEGQAPGTGEAYSRRLVAAITSTSEDEDEYHCSLRHSVEESFT